MNDNKLFYMADDKYLNAVVLYGHTDNKLYKDEKHKVVVADDEFANIADMRLIVEYSGSRYTPANIKKSTNYEVVILTNSGATVTAVTLKTSTNAA